MSFENVREEELKNRIAETYFPDFDYKKIIGDVDFCVSVSETQSLLWAEAKKGKADLLKSIVQLILTIGKARTFDKSLPPAFLGAFDSEKIAFIPYNDIQEVFYQNDFNWNVTPSNYETKEFGIVLEKVRTTIEENSLLFFFENDEKELREFIQINFVLGKSTSSKIQIDKNNFIIIYNKWLQSVKPTITTNWEIAKKNGIIDADFYLADLLSLENETLKDKLYVLLKKDHYQLDRKINEMGFFNSSTTSFTDKQKAHTQFWNKYQRPPREEYWDYIVERRDLLLPQDVRERKGSFFTPQIWVELSQKYLADTLGENWQDEYYIWDCAAGTGNLLAGLTNKYHIWASTLDRQDVDVMRDRIQNGANLLESHVFQFDFLNDAFDKLPKELQEIINDPEKRKKLVIYINPPYAEHGNRTTILGKGEHKSKVATVTKIHEDLNRIVGTATRELFAQFFLRTYKDIPDSILASFSTLKFINSQNFLKFRQYFRAEFQKGFICRANTFDNVNGKFPIAFSIWRLANKIPIEKISVDIVLNNPEQTLSWKEKTKFFYSFGEHDFISAWLRKYYDKNYPEIGYLILPGVDMQQQNGVYITAQPTKSDILQHKTSKITKNNLLIMVIYLTVRQCIEHTWTNNQDQFLQPNDLWKTDTEFQNDCLTSALFHRQNKVSTAQGTNHWIPFKEQELDAAEKFESDFMFRFIQGKLPQTGNGTLLETEKQRTTPLEFSAESKAVFEAGRKLWKYYHFTINHLEHWMPKGNVNASLYDIREYFQGRNEKGRMNSNSEDEIYTQLMADLRSTLQILAKKIEPKVYEYGFLRD